MPRAEGLGHREGRMELERGGTGVTTPAEVVRRGVFPDAFGCPVKFRCGRVGTKFHSDQVFDA